MREVHQMEREEPSIRLDDSNSNRNNNRYSYFNPTQIKISGSVNKI